MAVVVLDGYSAISRMIFINKFIVLGCNTRVRYESKMIIQNKLIGSENYSIYRV